MELSDNEYYCAKKSIKRGLIRLYSALLEIDACEDGEGKDDIVNQIDEMHVLLYCVARDCLTKGQYARLMELVDKYGKGLIREDIHDF